MKAIILAAVALAFSVSQASAVSLAVKLACKDDYFAYCSMHSPGSPGVRKCMRANGSRLSQRCIGALADAGYIKKRSTKATVQVASYKAAKANNKIAQKAVAKKYAAKKPTQKYAAYKASKKVVAVRKAAIKTAENSQRPAKRYANKKYKQYASWD